MTDAWMLRAEPPDLPGLVLRGHVMDALIAEGSSTFDLLGSAEPYKLHWTDRTVPHVRLRGFPPTPLGRMRHRYRHQLRPALRKALVVRRTISRCVSPALQTYGVTAGAWQNTPTGCGAAW